MLLQHPADVRRPAGMVNCVTDALDVGRDRVTICDMSGLGRRSLLILLALVVSFATMTDARRAFCQIIKLKPVAECGEFKPDDLNKVSADLKGLVDSSVALRQCAMSSAVCDAVCDRESILEGRRWSSRAPPSAALTAG